MSDFFQAGRHPDADQLSAFVEHTLPAHEQQQTLAHLADCPACRQIVALSLPPVEKLPVAHAEPAGAGWFSGWRVAWGGVPLLATILVAALLFHERSTPPRESTRVEQPALSPQVVAPQPDPPVPLPRQKQLVRPPTPAAPASAGVVAERTPDGTMGGVLGGVGLAPAPPNPSANARSLSMFAASRGRFAPMNPAPLPSGLATISIASRGHQRLAIDADHALFLSEDEGKTWKAVAPQWEGRAVQVALTTTAPAVERAPAMRMKAAGPAGGVLSGTVTDQAGGVVPGATVNAFDSSNQAAQTAVTDQQGRFLLAALAAGRYRIEVEAPGFQKQSQAEEILPAQPAMLDFTLQVRAAAQTVTVEAATPTVDLLTNAPPPVLPPFELMTDDGTRWISADGESFTRKVDR